jgi:hypothetical protein
MALLNRGAISRLPASFFAINNDPVALKLETRVSANGGTLSSKADDATDDVRAQIDCNVRFETYSAANQAAIDS